MRRFLVLGLSLALAGCADSFGERADGFINPQLANSYIPLEGVSHLVLRKRGAAFVIAPGVAVTNAHNSAIIGKAPVIGTSRNYDLLYFHLDKNPTAATASPTLGESVVAYGEGAAGELRVARGTIRLLNVSVEPHCETCTTQSAFTFDGDAGPGFSGGPVVDATTGKLVGITFGYLDPKGRRMMYAYPIGRVRNELATIVHDLPADVD